MNILGYNIFYFLNYLKCVLIVFIGLIFRYCFFFVLKNCNYYKLFFKIEVIIMDDFVYYFM